MLALWLNTVSNGGDSKLQTPDPEQREVQIPREERLVPVIRAVLAKKLAARGFRTSEIARALKTTQPAVAQYLKGRRGTVPRGVTKLDDLLNPLTEKLAGRIRLGGEVELMELLEAARQVVIMNSGHALYGRSPPSAETATSLGLLRERLRLELDAAEKYLALANRTSDDYTKLLFRMIAADSIRHGDVVSQLISWLESGSKGGGSLPDESVLKSMAALEDSATEESLVKGVEVDHPVAQLLLRWIEIDEGKHDKMLKGLMALDRRGKKKPSQ